MSALSDRLDALEAENTRLAAEVDRLKGKVEPPPPPAPPGGQPYVKPQMSVTVLPDPLPPPLSWDNVRELRRMVGKAYPRLISMSSALDEQQALQRLGTAILVGEKFFGTDQLDATHSLAWWVDQARAVVDQNGGQADLDGDDFTAAAMALGVWHREWSPSTSMGFGLLVSDPSWSIRSAPGHWWPLKGQWRVTLQRGAILPAQWVAGASIG